MNRAPQDGHFMAQHHDLEFFDLGRPDQEANELQNALDRDVADRQEHDASIQPAKTGRHSTRIGFVHPTGRGRDGSRISGILLECRQMRATPMIGPPVEPEDASQMRLVEHDRVIRVRSTTFSTGSQPQ